MRLLCKYYFMRAAARQCLIMKKDFIDKLKTEDSVLGSAFIFSCR